MSHNTIKRSVFVLLTMSALVSCTTTQVDTSIGGAAGAGIGYGIGGGWGAVIGGGAGALIGNQIGQNQTRSYYHHRHYHHHYRD